MGPRMDAGLAKKPRLDNDAAGAVQSLDSASQEEGETPAIDVAIFRQLPTFPRRLGWCGLWVTALGKRGVRVVPHPSGS